MPAMTPDRVNFVDENNAGRRFLALLEHVAHARRADADKHLHKIRAADGEERHIRFACDSACQQCFARADRKSTRLNSSHRCISYAVFCLKKKKKKQNTI